MRGLISGYRPNTMQVRFLLMRCSPFHFVEKIKHNKEKNDQKISRKYFQGVSNLSACNISTGIDSQYLRRKTCGSCFYSTIYYLVIMTVIQKPVIWDAFADWHEGPWAFTVEVKP